MRRIRAFARITTVIVLGVPTSGAISCIHVSKQRHDPIQKTTAKARAMRSKTPTVMPMLANSVESAPDDLMSPIPADQSVPHTESYKHPTPPMTAQEVWDFLKIGELRENVEAHLGKYSCDVGLLVDPAQFEEGGEIELPNGSITWSYRDGRIISIGTNSPSVQVNGIGVGSTFRHITEVVGQSLLSDPRLGYGVMIPIDETTWAGFSHELPFHPPDDAAVAFLERRADRGVIVSEP